MRFKHTLAGALAMATLSLAWAQTPGSGSTPPATGEAPGSTMGSGSGLSTDGNMTPEMRTRMLGHMQAMRDLRSRMNAAGSTSERQALMEEHLRLMDESMSLMQQLMGPHMGGPRGGMPRSGPGMGMPLDGSGAPGAVY